MTDGAFRGLMLNKGSNKVIMSYWPVHFLLWAAVSICSLIAVFVLFWVPAPASSRPGRIAELPSPISTTTAGSMLS